MTEIDLVDWTVQEAQLLNTARREPSKINFRSSLGKLLAVLDTEPAGPLTMVPSVRLFLQPLRNRVRAHLVKRSH